MELNCLNSIEVLFKYLCSFCGVHLSALSQFHFRLGKTFLGAGYFCKMMTKIKNIIGALFTLKSLVERGQNLTLPKEIL